MIRATPPEATAAAAPVRLHASAVAVDGRACAILGAAGSGKSTLALGMIALGAELVADDGVELRRRGDGLEVSAPPAIAGLIEARGIGLIRLAARPAAPLALLVDLDREEPARLPGARSRDLLGVPCPVILGRGRGGLAAALVVLLRAGTAALVDAGPAMPDATRTEPL